MYNLIVKQEKENFGLNDDFKFPYASALSRIYRNSYKGENNTSPLKPVEEKLVGLILCMSKMKRSLTVSEGLMLTNELIKGTDTQEALIQWKKKKNIYYSDEAELGKVGVKY